MPISSFYVQLSDYEIAKRLASGAFGQVSVGHHKTTQLMVAVKGLTCDVSNEDHRRHFEREVQILGTVRHPAILSLHGCTPFVHSPAHLPSILTPFMSRGSLADVLKLHRAGQPPPEWTLTRKMIILLGVASGMMFMHEYRFIHRDLKPANILLDDHFEPKIGDFGLSKFVEPGHSFDQTMSGGTAQFMAPEIFDGGALDFKADVYAFGIVMYMVLTGLEPFDDLKTVYLLGRRVCNGERPPIPRSIPRPFSEMIRACWEGVPRRRPDFKDIVRRLGQEICLERLDLDEFQEYQFRVVPPDLIAPVSDAFRARPRPPPGLALTPLETLSTMADEGNAWAQIQFGKRLTTGNGIEPDFARAADYFKRAADQGNAIGLLKYGNCLRTGTGVPKNELEAAVYYRRAIALNDPAARFRLGKMLRRGVGGVKDVAEAAQLFKAAGDSGHGLALNWYGLMLERGIGVARNIPEAVRCYQLSSDRACPEGMFNLADMFHHGKHVEQNVREAVRLYKLAADAGLPDALYSLYQIWKEGEGDVDPNPALAARAAEEHAGKGQFLGLLAYADVLEHGIGVDRDPTKANRLLVEAHSAKFAADQMTYALQLQRGKGCQQNYEGAIRYYRISAGHGNGAAAYSLGALYRAGKGTPQDFAEALICLRRAADEGHAKAFTALGEMFQQGSGVERDYSEAMRWFRLAELRTKWPRDGWKQLK
jgi:TPR repeat protein